MARRPPRTLSNEDRKLWSAVAKTVTRNAQPKKPVLDQSRPRPKPTPARTPEPDFKVQDFRIGETAPPALPGHRLSPSISDRLAAAPVRMDHATHKKMKRGKLSPEGRIDLHGMTLDQAHPALIGFIQRAQAQGKRLVLVITGKGKHRDDPGPIPARRGVLKHQVPAWLRAGPLSGLVLEIREAHLRHGGSGAYYVYLRRSR
ncbi:MAG: DNA mismatch repair protein MutS [Dinoroseobacter sp.]|jgi:DNA-nicking Smr family endonuclease|nr:DNA mismatch repair protein MutS [Dinoroseobacter sp.]